MGPIKFHQIKVQNYKILINTDTNERKLFYLGPPFAKFRSEQNRALAWLLQPCSIEAMLNWLRCSSPAINLAEHFLTYIDQLQENLDDATSLWQLLFSTLTITKKKKKGGDDGGVTLPQQTLMVTQHPWVSRYAAYLSALVLGEADWVYVHFQQWSSRGPEYLWDWLPTNVNIHRLLDWRQQPTNLVLLPSA